MRFLDCVVKPFYYLFDLVALVILITLAIQTGLVILLTLAIQIGLLGLVSLIALSSQV